MAGALDIRAKGIHLWHNAIPHDLLLLEVDCTEQKVHLIAVVTPSIGGYNGYSVNF